MTLAKMEMSELLGLVQEHSKRIGTTTGFLLHELALHVADLQTAAIPSPEASESTPEGTPSTSSRPWFRQLLDAGRVESMTEAARRVVRERDEARRGFEETSSRLIQQSHDLAAARAEIQSLATKLEQDRRALRDSREDHASVLAEIGRLNAKIEAQASQITMVQSDARIADRGRQVAMDHLRLCREVCNVFVQASKLETQGTRADYWRDEFLRLAGAKSDGDNADDRDTEPAT